MRYFHTFAATCAALTLAFPGIAQAAQVPAPCVTAAEFSALASYALPSVITGTAGRCSATLPSAAYLRRNSTELAQRYTVRREASWPGAKAAFLKVSGGNAEAAQLFATMPDEALRPMLDGLIASVVGQKLPVEQCTMIDRLVGLLAPLPPENTAELLTLAVGLGSKARKGGAGPFNICPA